MRQTGRILGFCEAGLLVQAAGIRYQVDNRALLLERFICQSWGETREGLLASFINLRFLIIFIEYIDSTSSFRYPDKGTST